MKNLLVYAFFAIVQIPAFAQDRPPIETVPISEASITISPKGSAYPGKQWKTRSFRIENTSERDFFVTGGSLDNVFIQVYTLDPTSGKWTSRGLLYCGFGSGRHIVRSGSAFTAKINLPIEHSERKFLIEFTRYSDASDHKGTVTSTLPLSMKSSPEAEQTGPAQPATKPAEKVPAEVRPPPPTSEDTPR